jgi:isocitrate/isopropylmalate dehydrogenase
MMNWLGGKNNDDELTLIGSLIDESVADHLRDGKGLTYDLGGDASCSSVGEGIAARLATKLQNTF